MRSTLVIVLSLVLVGVALAQRNNFNNNGGNFRGNNNNNNFNNNPNYRHVEPVYSYGLDTSNGQYAKFNGPVKGLPAGHGGGRYGQ